MGVKTRDGWQTSRQIAAQDKAWKKSRSTLMDKLGTAADDTQSLLTAAEKFFKEMDADGNGQIDHGELKNSFASLGLQLTKKEVNDMIQEADGDGDGFIDLQEFQALVKIEVSRWKRYQKTSSFCAIA